MSKEVAMTEKRAKDRIKKVLEVFAKYNDIYSFCPMTFGYGDSGHPDRIVLINGQFIGVEVKKDMNNHHCRPELKAKPNEVMQKRQAENIRKASGQWLCIHNFNLLELVSLLDHYAKVPHTKFSEADIKALNKLYGETE